jgi:hypothetical protein
MQEFAVEVSIWQSIKVNIIICYLAQFQNSPLFSRFLKYVGFNVYQVFSSLYIITNEIKFNGIIMYFSILGNQQPVMIQQPMAMAPPGYTMEPNGYTSEKY